MSDHSNGREQYGITINIHESFYIQYWSKEFEITPDMLKEMVLRLGTSAEVVVTPCSRYAALPRKY
jgi:hypothetical protein